MLKPTTEFKIHTFFADRLGNPREATDRFGMGGVMSDTNSHEILLPPQEHKERSAAFGFRDGPRFWNVLKPVQNNRK